MNTPEPTSSARRQVPALVRGLAILWTLTDGPLTAPEITRAVRLPRTTVHELLKTLDQQGMVRHTDGRYTLGMRLFELGMAAGRHFDLNSISQEITAEISAQVGETVQVAILDETDVVYVAKSESNHAVKLVSHIGSRVPAHVTAVGKALLAFQDSGWLDERFPPGQPLRKLTSRSITDPAALREELDAVARIGIATEYCESNDDVRCVAAPIREFGGRVVAALSISVPVYRWSDGDAERFEAAVLTGARRIGAALGHHAR